ncbi:hypothetical protein [Dactylosporangium sp. NPDC049140]|uniref:hypothetical protein n=1 Tax=Dactylosporangium sp. NPDC049140 TaxID=3155647 RepID=UPI0033D6ADE7
MVPPPLPPGIAATLDALRADAATWLAAAAAMSTAADAAGGLTLDAGRMSAAAELAGLTRVYGEVRARAADLLAGAARAGATTAAALDEAADAYERGDRW